MTEISDAVNVRTLIASEICVREADIAVLLTYWDRLINIHYIENIE